MYLHACMILVYACMHACMRSYFAHVMWVYIYTRIFRGTRFQNIHTHMQRESFSKDPGGGGYAFVETRQVVGGQEDTKVGCCVSVFVECVHARVNVCVCARVGVCVRVRACVCTCMHACIHAYIHKHVHAHMLCIRGAPQH